MLTSPQVSNEAGTGNIALQFAKWTSVLTMVVCVTVSVYAWRQTHECHNAPDLGKHRSVRGVTSTDADMAPGSRVEEYERQGRYQEADELFFALVSTDGSDVAGKVEVRLEAVNESVSFSLAGSELRLIERARDLLLAKDYLRAVAHYERAARISNNHDLKAYCRYCTGICYRDYDDRFSMHQVFDKLRRDLPASPWGKMSSIQIALYPLDGCKQLEQVLAASRFLADKEMSAKLLMATGDYCERRKDVVGAIVCYQTIQKDYASAIYASYAASRLTALTDVVIDH